MKNWIQNLKRTTTLTLTTSLLVACGGKFEATSNSSESRPPATSDPLTSQQQRQWESAQQGRRKIKPILETEAERESFLQDLTEQMPTYSTDDLAKDAETQFQKNEKQRLAKAAAEKAEKEKAEKERAEQEPAKKDEDVPTVDPAPVPQPPVKTPDTPVVPKETLPKEPATKTPAPEAPTSSVKSDFCDDLNVTAPTGEGDFSALYNDDAALPKSMPTKELGAASGLEKKNKFICILLPVAIRMNEEVYRQRMEVIRLNAKSKQSGGLSAEDAKWLSDLKLAYGLKAGVANEELLKRVDIIPLPLLLAQAAIESGWGSSRAAGDLKNIFGMHAAAGQPCEKSNGGTGACLRKFSTLSEGVSAYIRLLNVGSHYGEFREARNEMRLKREPLDSLRLLEKLGDYNETPKKYIQDVREIMTKHNKLTQFNFKEEEVEAAK